MFGFEVNIYKMIQQITKTFTFVANTCIHKRPIKLCWEVFLFKTTRWSYLKESCLLYFILHNKIRLSFFQVAKEQDIQQLTGRENVVHQSCCVSFFFFLALDLCMRPLFLEMLTEFGESEIKNWNCCFYVSHSHRVNYKHQKLKRLLNINILII